MFDVVATPAPRQRIVAALVSCAMLCATGFPVPAAAADDPNSDWLGKKVFVKVTARPRVGNRTFEWNSISMPATVSKVQGSYLWLGAAWVTPNEVVTLDDAPAYYTDLMKRMPGGVPYMLRGVAWQLKRDYANAVKDFTEAIRIEPDYFLSYRMRAQAWHSQGQYQKALDDLNETIRLNPSFALAYNDRGAVYNELDDYHRAYEQLNEAIRIDPKLALAYYNRAANWHDQEQYDKAIADFDAAIAVDPKLAMAYNGRGYTYSRQGNYGKAAKDFETAIRLEPYEPWGYLNFARMWSTADSEGPLDGKRAVEAATKACELDHWSEWLCVATLAAAYAECGDFDKAVQYQEKAIAMDIRPEHKDKVNAQERLELYKAHKPYREKSMPPPAPKAEEADDTSPQ